MNDSNLNAVLMPVASEADGPAGVQDTVLARDAGPANDPVPARDAVLVQAPVIARGLAPVHAAGAIPMATPYGPMAAPHSPMAVPYGSVHQPPMVRVKTDGMAIASAVCGLTAIIPVISQVIGFGLGIASLSRIRKARARGVDMPGRGWAWTGIITSGFALLGWVAMLALLLIVGASISTTVDSLNGIALPVP